MASILGRIAQHSQILLPVQRVVVDADLAVQRHQFAARRHHQRVDLDQRQIVLHEQLEQAFRHPGKGSDLRTLQVQAESDIAALKILQPPHRIAYFAQDLVRIGACDFLDFHTAAAGSHQHDALGFAVHGQAEVNLARDIQRLFHQQARHHLSVGCVLVSHQTAAEQRAHAMNQIVQGAHHAHPARLAASAGVNLRLDHPGISTQMPRRHLGLACIVQHHAARRGNALIAQQLFCLIFVQIHYFSR